ncbi:MAG: hypothetical protein OEW30_04765 [Acidimicrobiia bacterium]|nr:hypothetical protein [Acidimicrobiia bacterium]MDH4353710.1 hypothetical protein [Actinomycetota bacterium]MDH5293773.1 hypothetical protein [Acidimicrobiia bacterium]
MSDCPDVLRLYPIIAAFVENAVHVIPIAALVALLGEPKCLEWTF